MKIISYYGKKYKVMRSDRPDKKYKINIDGKEIHFGARGYSIAAGTKKGDRYCARSSGIPTPKTGLTPNRLSRIMWRCQGKKSIRY